VYSVGKEHVPFTGTKLGTRSFSNIGTKNGKEFLFLRNFNENDRYSNYEKENIFNNNIF
jgi:hypothetical protein